MPCGHFSKRGNEEALAFLGYIKNPPIEVKNFTLNSKIVFIGDALEFGFTLEVREDTKLMIDYIIHFKTKTDTLNPKVHKLKKISLKKGSPVSIEKKHLFKADMSTRILYKGEHKLSLQINGTLVEDTIFYLQV